MSLHSPKRVRVSRGHLTDLPSPVERARALLSAAGFGILAGMGVSTSANAQSAPDLTLPVDCAIGETCFLQNYMDADAGPNATDFTCGGATYDGHKGTDIRVPTLAEIANDVAVIAAAPGTVKGTRDGMADTPLTDAVREEIRGRECGNGAVIDHGGGWETQYCHLKQGSISVSAGQSVEAGTVIGTIGQSGWAEFPHVHFEVRKDGTPVDPFTGTTPADGCDATGDRLWSDQVAQLLSPPTSQVIASGFADGAIKTSDVTTRTDAPPPPEANWPAIVYYVLTINLREGDRQRITFTGPNGRESAQETDPLDRSKAQYIVFAGRRQPEGGWPAGSYTMSYQLIRDGQVIVELSDGFQF